MTAIASPLAPRQGVAPELTDRRWDETAAITALRSAFRPCPFQRNDVFETDAELLDVGNGKLLALTIDTVQENPDLRAAAGPYEIGWLAVTASLSDLAAVGAEPIAVLLAWSLPPQHFSLADLRQLSAGAADAAHEQSAFIVGGDTNAAPALSVATAAWGWVEAGTQLRRIGAHAGDALYTTGPIGGPNATVARRLFDANGTALGDVSMPRARCTAGRVLRGRTRACMDTSDGLLAAVATLAELNRLGVEIQEREGLYEPRGAQLMQRLGLPTWLLAAGEWGEYELLFAIPQGEAEQECCQVLADLGLHASRIGQFHAGSGVVIRQASGERIRPNAARLRQVFASLDTNADILAQLHDRVTMLYDVV